MNTNAIGIRSQCWVRLAAILASIVLSGYAEAGNRTVKVSETVSATDINVNTPEGARKLYVRLQAASRRVCAHIIFDLEVSQSRCEEETLANVIRSADRPQLTMIYLRSHTIQTAEAHGIKIPTVEVAASK